MLTVGRATWAVRVTTQHPIPVLEAIPDDVAAVGLRDGELVEVRSRCGALLVTLEVSAGIRPGTVFLPMHWGASQGDLACEANRLMHALGCPLSRQPELKAAAVCLRPGGAGVCVSKAP